MPVRPTPRRKTVLLPIVGLILLSLAGIAVFAYLTARVGIVAELVGFAGALLPVGPVVAVFLWIDRWEPEPAKLLWLGFAWGAFGATLTALLINNTAEAVGDLLLGKGGGDTIAAVVSAPLIEEAAKAAFVLGIYLWKRQEFNGVIDGIVYAGTCAAGFAFTENIYYFGRIFGEHGFGTAQTAGVIAAFILRGVMSPFTHPLFTVMTGIGIGVAAGTSTKWVKVAAPVGGYLAAVVLHALWNSAATLGNATTFLNVYFLIMLPVFVMAAVLVNWARKREQKIIAAALPRLVSEGLIAAGEVEVLANLKRRREWRRKVARKSGPEAGRAVADYQTAVTELAFHRHSHPGDEAERLLEQAVRVSRATAVSAARRQ
ncbi:PrsW family intramembrane metalloprotease [Kibdelosporangium phytohabitans]|uniref:PrsW family intramembrane metalloprotease n=1 Tax=Kibdelosporangium phytohabitans TaxID=860235 RepID=UPI000A4129A8|nr:PrsW family intramembrane metalloprotease [Kibdelosporangium phytohabitans]MBE1466066.1 RsiW-degrading membrane proteinase PrsW (M82 family) [Kibdelosporangium phytohabitans]